MQNETAEEMRERIRLWMLVQTPDVSTISNENLDILCRIAQAADAHEKRNRSVCLCGVCLAVREAREKGVLL